jgi:molecular chaperone HscB
MTDPFELLGIEPRFSVDLAAVEQRHRDLSKALHPDRYAGAPPTERRLALSRAIDVNEAMRILRDPVRRAEALLRRAGVAVGELSEPKPSPELLMEMMEAREQLADARRAKSAARVAGLANSMQGRQAEVEDRLRRALDASPVPTRGAADVLPALGELRYVRRFLDEVSAIQEELSP